MDMTINCLPERTWNHLGMNESKIRLEGEVKMLSGAVRPQEDSAKTQKNPAVAQEPGEWESFREIETGMGPELERFFEETVREESIIKRKEGGQVEFFCRAGELAAGRLYIHAGKNSSLSLVCVLAGEKEGQGTALLQIKILAEEGACVKLYMAQLLGDGFTCLSDMGILCKDGASVEAVKLELGAEKLYTGALAGLLGKESTFKAQIGYHVRNGQRMDMNYGARHRGEGSMSALEAFGVLEEGAFKLFRGTIDFKRGCRRAKGTEKEEVLLLGDKVVNQTIPLILCAEEDVEGDHGATIGRLDEKMLFYLGSRGIDEETAGQMVAGARIQALSEQIPSGEVREKIREFQKEHYTGGRENEEL